MAHNTIIAMDYNVYRNGGDDINAIISRMTSGGGMEPFGGSVRITYCPRSFRVWWLNRV